MEICHCVSTKASYAELIKLTVLLELLHSYTNGFGCRTPTFANMINQEKLKIRFMKIYRFPLFLCSKDTDRETGKIQWSVGINCP